MITDAKLCFEKSGLNSKVSFSNQVYQKEFGKNTLEVLFAVTSQEFDVRLV